MAIDCFKKNVSRTSVELVMLVSKQRQDGCDKNVINNNDQLRSKPNVIEGLIR